MMARLAEFDAVIDARSESEYAEDRLPGAINWPSLNDAERHEVGTLYKQVSPFDAKKKGAALVARNIGRHLENTLLDKPRDWKPLIYCWRGGNRSGAMAHILAKVGWQAVQLDGGYKEYRRQVNQAMAELPARFRFIVVCGTTGSGKSRLLQTLARHGAQVLDLEQLAAHRGSVLGHLPSEPQPSQKMFESRLWHGLQGFDPSRPVYVESESKKVGNLRVPEALMEKIRASECVSVQLSQADRVALLMEDYVHFVEAPQALNVRLDCLAMLYGRDKISHWQQLALEGKMRPLVEELLTDHYDPAYNKSIRRNFTRFGDAMVLEIKDISAEAFDDAVTTLLAADRGRS
ncbi:MAG TPA: tRNA 2-selenouridine(34) synthase MnmH [Noviherbaspirillum sp.]